MEDDRTLPTQAEVDAILAVDVDEEELEKLFQDENNRKIAVQLFPMLSRKFKKAADAEAAKKLQELSSQLMDENKKALQTEIDKMRKANQALTPEELQKLLSQEYLEFTIPVRGRPDFVVTELPIRDEQRLLKVLKTTLGSVIKEIGSVDFTAGKSAFEKVQRLIEMFPEALDTLAECCAICLSRSAGEGKFIDAEWVKSYLPVNRMYAILEAQAAANRWRDFFSRVYQTIPGQMIG